MIDPIAFLTLLLGVAVLLMVIRSDLSEGSRALLARATPTDLTPIEFKELPPHKRTKTKQLLQEQTVRSLGHRYIGKFDAAVVAWEDAPIAHILLERKYPSNHLPTKARSEDFFQTGLYALALMESGYSCARTTLMVIYCLQDRALRCKENSNAFNCGACRSAKVFSRAFKPKDVLRKLRKLDEIWYAGRRPEPQPSQAKCQACPYGASACQFSVA